MRESPIGHKIDESFSIRNILSSWADGRIDLILDNLSKRLPHPESTKALLSRCAFEFIRAYLSLQVTGQSAGGL